MVFYHGEVIKAENGTKRYLPLSLARSLDHLTLERPITAHATNNRLRPKIKRRALTEIKMMNRGVLL